MTPQEIGSLIEEFRRRNALTQRELAKNADVDQSQISRILNGNFKLGSKNVVKLCKYAKIQLESKSSSKINPSENKELMEALQVTWDGSTKNAKALSKVIRCLKALL